MSGPRLFPLAANEEIRIVLKIEDGGEVYNLVHIFRGLTAEDKKAFWGWMGRTELAGGERSQGGDYLGAVELLYDRSVKRVEGYEPPEAAERWRELIPLEHKAWAVGRLLKSAGTLSEEAQKK
ncbi:MAG: hypothetical protein JXQ83_15350 [Candidatus Glassbacteria bacterium]|nr:hypothetical protein [Candidatus Glassbacteria bacterium]